ncbi:integral membrane family protein [Coprinopsis cinerea okayama7|uniref:Integral membrane family protein n=1 Tax=Coprinopsis cinerea (strain Okayama-7 / 130 / ATCC MYA-4618 / FGSC 9003) TaxID=240176 RepID=A8N658_COPC7|nr:integral membrane family protein [Coprinopsis cinerea okayama7\|eukprot:XP_001830338.2 integral membrane family protein [Coprinopsis cinerea okayama7\
MVSLPWIPLVLAVLLSGHGLRKKSLSPTGALTAFFVGFLSLAGGTYAFGVTLLVFYFTGSRATKYGKKQKAQLEDGYHEAGYRGGWQVLSNSATALIATFLWNTLFTPSSPHAALSAFFGLDIASQLGIGAVPTYDNGPEGWCPLDVTIANGWSRLLVLAIVGHFACCLGDTLASELGILSRAPPRLITTFKPVPPGTNGAMSTGGTIASIAGGAIVGLVMGVSLALENVKCSSGLGGVLLGTIGWGMFGGGFGSLTQTFCDGQIRSWTRC